MRNIIQKQIEWEEAREGHMIFNYKEVQLEKIDFFDQRESEFQNIELIRLRKVAEFN